jgi:uncharacterized protein (TIGR03437 family)
LLFSTYIGGAGADLARGLVYTASRVIVALQTESSGFPTSAGAAQAARAGAADLYLLGVRPDGSAALTATYFGGAGADEPNSLYLDPAGNLLVAGRTASANFPTMEGSPARAGATDAFVLKLNTNFGLVFSRLIGGSGAEAGLAVSADASNNVYVGGDTASADFPATTGAFQTRQKGDADAFIAKLTPAGAIVYNTLLGGEGGEAVFALAPDAQGAVTAAGFSFSTGFPVTADAWQTASAIDYADKLADAFLTRLNPAGTALQFSTLLGGNFGEEARALHVDGAGIATLAGATYADDWPVTAGALKATLGACRVDLGSDCQRLFLAKVDLNRNEASGPRVLLNGVVGAADYFRGGVAPGDVITVYGSEIGPPALAGLQLDSSGAVSRSLAGARILFDGTPAALVYVSSGQVSAVVPYQVGGNPTTTLVAEYQGRRSNPVVLPVRASRMALFTANSSGAGQAAALNADGSFNRRGSAVARGSVIVLYGTGMGMLDPAPPIGGINGLPLPRPVGEVTATIGGKNANVQYAGGAPGLIAGVVQVNLEVPPDAPVGDAVPVEIRVNGAPSRTGVTIAVR